MSFWAACTGLYPHFCRPPWPDEVVLVWLWTTACWYCTWEGLVSTCLCKSWCEMSQCQSVCPGCQLQLQTHSNQCSQNGCCSASLVHFFSGPVLISLVGQLLCYLYFGSSWFNFALFKSPKIMKREWICFLCEPKFILYIQWKQQLSKQSYHKFHVVAGLRLWPCHTIFLSRWRCPVVMELYCKCTNFHFLCAL